MHKPHPGSVILESLEVRSSHQYFFKVPQVGLPWQLSPEAMTTEPVHLEPMLRNKRSHCSEKPQSRGPRFGLWPGN